MKKFYSITTYIGVLFALLISSTAYSQFFDMRIPQCNATSANQTLSFTGATPNANGDGTFTLVYWDADLDGSGTNLENIVFNGETGSSFGQTAPSTGQCNATRDSVTFIIPMADINAWAATGGSIDILLVPNANVNPTLCSPTGYCYEGRLAYPVATGPNDVGASAITPTVICPGPNVLQATISNFGTNQVDSVWLNWSKNGVLQTPVHVVSLIDTAGGASAATTTVSLGSHTFTAGATEVFQAWTTLPNGVIDTASVNDSVTVGIKPALTGVFTVGGASPDYANFAAVLADLNNIGVCGPVTFNVREGTYTEQLDFTLISGVSATNTILFQPDAANSAPVIIEHAASAANDNYVVRFSNSSHITFDGITVSATGATLAYALYMQTASHVTIRNCELNSNPASTGFATAALYNASGLGVDSCIIENNNLNYGYYGMYWYGAGIGTNETGNIIRNNNIKDFRIYGLSSYYQAGNIVENNSIEQVAGVTGSSYGLYAFYNDSAKIRANQIILTGSGLNYGLYLFRAEGSATNKTEVYNNMISTSPSSTSTTYGVFLNSGRHINFYHNTVYTNGGGGINRTFYLVGGAAGQYDNVDVRNNIFVNDHTGDAVYLNTTAASSTITIMDYNIVSAATGNVFSLNGTGHTPASWITATGLDSNSLNGTPGFISSTDLRLQGGLAADAGLNLGVMVDFEGDIRPLAPSTGYDIGADEYIPPTCPAPSLLTSFGVSSTSGNITWTPVASDSIYEIQYDITGFTLGSGTTLASANDTALVSGLLPAGTYDVYLRSICSVGDTSIWIGPYTFTTLCSVIPTPYTQDFDLMTISGGQACYAIDDISQCWSNDLLTSNLWQVRSANTTSLNTGPPSDNTSGSGNYVYIETGTSAGCPPGTKSTMNSPLLDLSTLNTATVPELVFFYHMYGATIDSLNVFISNDNGTTWTNIWAEFGDKGNQWNEANVVLANYVGDTVQFRFVATKGTSFTADIAVDDITVRNAPTCPKPSSFVNYLIESDSAGITWTQGINDSLWELEYGALGFMPGAGTRLSLSTDSANIGGLSPITSYSFYVRGICTVGDTSAWFGPFTITTPCAIYAPPYSEDFVSMAFNAAPACWEEGQGALTVNSTVATGTSLWTTDGFANVLFNGSAKLNIAFTTRAEWLISPSIDIGNGTVPYQVEFDIALTDAFGARPTDNGTLGLDDKIALIISTDNGITWSDTNILRQWDSTDIPSYLGQYFAFDLTAAGYTGAVKLAIYGESTVSNESTELFIDNFGVVEVPTCPRPLDLASVSATITSATFTWTNGANDVSWIMEHGLPGFTPGTGTLTSVATNPGVINGLNPSTCYDVYLTSICGVGDTSVRIGPLRFCTECAPVTDLCEDFENFSSGLPICWEKFVATTPTGTSDVTISTFGGNIDPNCVRLTSGNDATTTLLLITPEMTALTAGTHRAVFSLDASNSLDTMIVIGTILDPTNPGTFIPWDTITDIATTYKDYSIPFINYTGAHTRIAFLYTPGATFRTMAIDDFCFEVIPTCEKPPAVDILSAGLDSTSMDIGWNLDTAQVSYLVAYGPAGYDPITNPANGDTVTAQFNFRTVTGLEPLTEYCFWVKAVCTNGDTSFWDGPHCGSTGCPPGIQLPYTEDFSTYRSVFPLDETPQCWYEATGGLSAIGGITRAESNWEVDGFANVNTTGAARFNVPTFGTREGWLITPTFDFGSDPNRARIIEFDVAVTDRFNTNPAPNGMGGDDTVAFVVSYDEGQTWSTSDILVLWDSLNVPSNTANRIVYTMRSTSGLVKFGFFAKSSVANAGLDFHLDNFSIRDTTWVGIEENSAQMDEFQVYPNPNTGVFSVLNSGVAKTTSVKLMDIQGRIVYDERLNFSQKGIKEIEVESLKSGVYVLLIQSEGRQEQHRVVIQ